MPLQVPPAGELAESLAQRTTALCGMFSPIGEERALCDAVAAWARARFARVERVKDWRAVRAEGAPLAGRPGGRRAARAAGSSRRARPT